MKNLDENLTLKHCIETDIEMGRIHGVGRTGVNTAGLGLYNCLRLIHHNVLLEEV